MAWSYDENATRPNINTNLFDRIKANFTPQACVERDKYREEVDRFHSSVAPFIERIDITKDKTAWLTAQCMQIFFIDLQIGLDNCFEKDEVSYDRFTPKFLDILYVAKSILNNHDNAYFIPNTQVVLGLSLISQKCRVPFIRREAIKLLRMMNRREVCCDSEILAGICEWIVVIEEEGMVDGYVPEEARTRGVIIAPDHQKQGVYVSCKLTKKGGLLGEIITRETLLKW